MTQNHRQINTILEDFVSSIKLTLGENLVGVYLYGSYATGDFDDKTSDIDLLMVVNDEIDAAKQHLLTDLQNAFNISHQLTSTKLDVAYVTVQALKTFKNKLYSIVVSDGEGGLKTHIAPAYYLIDWYKIQQHGVVLYGPPINKIIPHIAPDEFTETMLNYMHLLRDQVAKDANRGHLAYIVITMCRSSFARRHGEHVSKKAGANWAMGKYPQWSHFIQKAVLWNRDEKMNKIEDKVYQEQTLAFVAFILSETTTKA